MEATDNSEQAQPLGLALTEGLGLAPERYPLDVVNCSGDDCAALMSKGHHDSAAFLKAAEEYWGEPLNGWDGPTQTWWRVVPDSTGEYRHMYHEANPHSLGAFPVTVMCLW